MNAADLLDIYYFKDTADRYLFSFPGLPVVLSRMEPSPRWD